MSVQWMEDEKVSSLGQTNPVAKAAVISTTAVLIAGAALVVGFLGGAMFEHSRCVRDCDCPDF